MKRPLLHILFWVCYFGQLLLVEYLWTKATIPQLPADEFLPAVLLSSVLYLIPQIMFSYYLAYVGIPGIIKHTRPVIFSIAGIAIALFLGILLDRAIGNYLVTPYAYDNLLPVAPLLEPRRLLVGLLYLGFAAGAMYVVKSVRNELITKEREKNLIKEKLETELKFLRNQTNPHFLLNTLNNIYALARKNSEDTAEAVMRLSELLRFMLYESGGKLIALADEIKVLQDYLELEMMRYDERLSISFNKETDNPSYKITPLLLLPFVENAFKHGISETRFESFINIDIRGANGYLFFEIENTKDSGEHNNHKANIGLVNVQRQLELTYSDYKLDVTNDHNTFKVNLSINLDSYVEI